jgi:hypothetical protein
VLVEVVKDLAPTMIGFIYPFSESATPQDELEKRVGYQSDPAVSINEARALLQRILLGRRPDFQHAAAMGRGARLSPSGTAPMAHKTTPSGTARGSTRRF